MGQGPRFRSNLAVRVATAAIGIPLVLAVNYFGGWVFGIVVGVAALVAEIELLTLLRAGGYRPATILCIPATIALAVIPLTQTQVERIWMGVLVLIIGLCGAYYLAPATCGAALKNWWASIAAAVYVGLFLGHLSLLREVTRGARWIVLILILTWAYDTGAYFAGKYAGRRGFMRHISPNKTMEGVAGGLLLAAAAGLAGIPLVGLAAWQGIILGALTGVVGQTGDLVESMIKRQTGVKDSGTIIPGHGGVLDRIDSLLFTGVLGYYAAVALGYAS